MNEDFSNLNLYWSERFKLFVMRFIEVDERFLGESVNVLTRANLISHIYEFCDTQATGEPVGHQQFKLTDRYRRYVRWKRNRLISNILGNILLPFVVAVITALCTTLLQQYLSGCK